MMEDKPSEILGLIFKTHYCNYVWNNRSKLYYAYSISRNIFQQSRSTKTCEKNVLNGEWQLVK